MTKMAGIASELLQSSPDLLEMNTRKFRNYCFEELETIAVTGCVSGHGRVRAVLLTAGSLMRVDVQELESLNSMIKIATARAGNNRIGLSLLSSRVCLRKVIAMNTNGSTRVKDIKPFAAYLARSATLFSEGYHALQDDDTRWSPPTSNSLSITFDSGKQQSYDPVSPESLRASRWAMKYHTLFMKQFKVFWRDKHISPNEVIALVVPSDSNENGYVHWAGCMTVGKQVLMVKLRMVETDGATSFVFAHHNTGSGPSFQFETSLGVVGSLCSMATERKRNNEPLLDMGIQTMIVHNGNMLEPHGPVTEICKLRARYEHKPKLKRRDPDDDDDAINFL